MLTKNLSSPYRNTASLAKSCRRLIIRLSRPCQVFEKWLPSSAWQGLMARLWCPLRHSGAKALARLARPWQVHGKAFTVPCQGFGKLVAFSTPGSHQCHPFPDFYTVNLCLWQKLYLFVTISNFSAGGCHIFYSPLPSFSSPSPTYFSLINNWPTT